jgi:carboxymethylenebutenolidase
MGGGYTLALAVNEPRLKAAAMNYGRLVTDPAAIAKIKASLLGNFAGQDKGIATADVRAFEANLRAAGKDVDIKVYDADGHAFMNPNNKGMGGSPGYDEAAAKDAWLRIETFLAKKLQNG